MKYVLLGEHTLNTNMDDAKPKLYTVVERIVHENFTGAAKYFNIALLRLNEDVSIDYYIRPACLATGRTNDKRAIATGWGHTDFGGEESDTLQKVTLDIFSHEDCAKAFEKETGRPALKDGILDELHLCAGHRMERKDTCQVIIIYM